MSTSGIQGQQLKIEVVSCKKLKLQTRISRQNPYACIDYCNTKFQTRTCTGGGETPIFQEKFKFSLIEGFREVNLTLWNSHTLSTNDFIGTGKVQLQKVLSEGFDDSHWPLQTNSGKYAGEVRLIMRYANANKPATCEKKEKKHPTSRSQTLPVSRVHTVPAPPYQPSPCCEPQKGASYYIPPSQASPCSVPKKCVSQKVHRVPQKGVPQKGASYYIPPYGASSSIYISHVYTVPAPPYQASPCCEPQKGASYYIPPNGVSSSIYPPPAPGYPQAGFFPEMYYPWPY